MDFNSRTLLLPASIFIVVSHISVCDSILFAADDDIPCGIPDIEPVSNRIIGGHEARFGSWPWMALLAEEGFHICGGSILNERIILTAAHCFDSDESKIPSRWTIYTGKYELTKIESSQTKHDIDRILTYPAYNSSSLKHDIAIVVLKDPVTYSNLVRPICIPPTFYRMVPQNTMCYTAGWGDTRGTSNPYILNQVGLPILHDYWCSRPDWYGSRFIPKLTFCAGYQSGRKDACLGDSGGPYICKVNGTWYQQGIVSWGYDCGQPRWPGIFTDVSKYRKWILKTMNDTGFPLQQ